MSKFIDGIKAYFNTQEEVKKFKDAKTSEGLILKISDDLVIGAKVEIVNEDGTLTIPLDGKGGDLTLEDGSIVTVDEAGLITEYVPKDAVATEGEDEAMSGETKDPAKEVVKNSAIKAFKLEKFWSCLTLKDGTSVYTSAEAFTIDAPLFKSVYNAETDYYDQVPVEDGTLETADGSNLVIKDGKLESMNKAGVESAEKIDDKNQEENMKKELEELKASISFLAEKLSQVNTVKVESVDIVAEKDKEIEKLSKTMTELFAENQKLSKQPAGQSISTKKVESNEEFKTVSLKELLATNKKPETK